MEEEAHRQYRELMGKEKKKNTSDQRKLTEATVVTSEMVWMLRKERERVDAAKAARIAKHQARSLKTASATKMVPLVETSGGHIKGAGTPEAVDRVIEDEVEDLW